MSDSELDLTTYWEVIDILSSTFEEVNGYDFYRDIFPAAPRSYEQHTDFSHPYAIMLCYNEEKNRRHRHMLYCDTWEDDYIDLVERKPDCLCGGLTYRKNRNTLENAQCMNALIFDLDGVGAHELRNVLHRFTLSPKQLRSLPIPTYLVASGTGIHFYYVFDEPIDLFPNIKLQLKSMKHDLTFKIWEYKATSKEKSIQYQSINQGFRMVGSINSKHDNEIRAFKIGDKVTIDYMNRFVIDPKNAVDLQKRFRPSRMTREQAKLTYPEWYERVIVNGEKRMKKWDIAGKVNGDDPYALYHWWLRQIEHIKGGHRYFFLMCMAIYACKCDVPKAKLKADMEEAYQKLQDIEHKNPMKREDIKSALEAYSKDYYNFLISDIERLCEIRIERNKRNGQKQEWHLEDIRDKKKNMKRRGQAFKNPEGRPKGSGTAQEKVQQYLKEHPEASVTEVAKALKLSRTTVYKWWDSKVDQSEQQQELYADLPKFYRYTPYGVEEIDHSKPPAPVYDEVNAEVIRKIIMSQVKKNTKEKEE